MAEPRYPFVHVDVPSARADELSAALFELGATGVEERDEGTLARGPGAGSVTLVGSFDDRAAAEEAVVELGRLDPSLSPRIEEVVGDAWRDAWKEHFAPFALTPRLVVRPPWIAAEAPDGGHVLELEPGRAFGTGLHATTSLCADALDARAERLGGITVLDVGTGSGILALAALVFGAARVVAIDNDPDVIEVVRENAERNGLAERIDARACTVDAVEGRFPVVVANIETRILVPMAPALVRAVAPGGLLVLSGILASEERLVAERYESQGLTLVEARRRGDATAPTPVDWVALVFEQRAAPP